MLNRVLALLLITFAQIALADNRELARLAADDQAARQMEVIPPGSDDERRGKVLELLAHGSVRTAQDKFNAALVLQHTGLTVCDRQLKSISAENYLLAHHLFKAALDGGVKDAKYLVAASIDRYLSFTEGYQRYGTNRVFDQVTGREMLVAVDRTVTDAERKKYGVPPLAELLSQFPEQPREPAGN
jgi:hypothetical protein